jgi:hypothetical protein
VVGGIVVGGVVVVGGTVVVVATCLAVVVVAGFVVVLVDELALLPPHAARSRIEIPNTTRPSHFRTVDRLQIAFLSMLPPVTYCRRSNRWSRSATSPLRICGAAPDPVEVRVGHGDRPACLDDIAASTDGLSGPT